jgi:hypothetical protein
MTTKQLIMGWLTTIIFGSILLPFGFKIYELFEGMPFKIQGDEFVGYMVFGLMISAVASIPAMALILTINHKWMKEIEPFQKRMRTSAAISTVLIALTFVVMCSLNASNILEAIPMFLSYALPSIGFHLYQCQKSYHKPQVLNFPA